MLAADVALARPGFALDARVEVGSGECLALVGPSGAGKSTLLRAVAGLLRPDRGTVTAGGETWFDSAAGVSLPVERRRVGLVFQDYALFPRMSAWRNVAYGAVGPRRLRRERAVGLLERFGIGDRARARPAELSGGERQRVALARALASEPRVLLLDEPLSALDSRTRAAAGRELAAVLVTTAVPTIVVTHDFAAGAVVLRGTASPAAGGLTRIELDGGGTIYSTDAGSGPVAAGVFPWEIALDRADAPAAAGSALNRIEAEVSGVTEFGNRARVGLAAPQPLAAEVTAASTRRLGLRPGSRVAATWKATATRLAPR